MGRTVVITGATKSITVNAVAPGPIDTDLFQASCKPGSFDEKAIGRLKRFKASKRSGIFASDGKTSKKFY